MFRTVTTAIFVLVTLPALAQSDAAIVDSIPLVISGVTPSAPGYLASIEAAPVVQTGPGAFTIADGKNEGKLAVTEIEPCVFELALELDGKAMGAFRLDANTLTEVVYTKRVPDGAETRFDVEFKGAEDTLLIVAPNGQTRAMPSLSGAKTGASLDDLTAAAAALKQACP
jgi:hypothetical protein